MTHRFTPDSDPDLDTLAQEVVDAGPPEPSWQRKRTVEDHVAMLAKEFSGQSALFLFHAATIVFIRREVGGEACRNRFRTLWRDYEEILLKGLDSRWLISACDTFADIAETLEERRTGALASLFANTIKLYETERIVTGVADVEPADYDIEAVQRRVHLYDGVTAFRIGRGDMVRSLLDRVEATICGSSPPERILRELLTRAVRRDTVFSRLATLHWHEETNWAR